MGFFSWTCAKTNLPIVASAAWRDHPFSKVVLLADEGRTVIKGTYDGYGRIAVQEATGDRSLISGGVASLTKNRLTGRIGRGEAKLVLLDRYDPSEGFHAIGRSMNDIAQGHAYTKDFLDRCAAVGSFASVEGYELACYRELPVEYAARLSSGEAKGFGRLKDRVAVEILSERARRFNAHSATPLVVGKKPFSLWMVLVPLPSGTGFSIRGRDYRSERTTDDLAVLDLRDGKVSKDELRKCAAQVVDASPCTLVSRVQIVRDGETLGVVRGYSSQIAEGIVSVVDASGDTHFFWDDGDALAFLGMERDEAWRLNGAKMTPTYNETMPMVVLELPSPGATPTMR